jgi:hypothetical protein
MSSDSTVASVVVESVDTAASVVPTPANTPHLLPHPTPLTTVDDADVIQPTTPHPPSPPHTPHNHHQPMTLKKRRVRDDDAADGDIKIKLHDWDKGYRTGITHRDSDTTTNKTPEKKLVALNLGDTERWAISGFWTWCIVYSIGRVVVECVKVIYGK